MARLDEPASLENHRRFRSLFYHVGILGNSARSIEQHSTIEIWAQEDAQELRSFARLEAHVPQRSSIDGASVFGELFLGEVQHLPRPMIPFRAVFFQMM